MDPILKVNERVDVVSVFHRQGHPNEICEPKKMAWRGHEIIFTERALRHPTTAGKRMIHVFHMSDGANNYRLEFDAEALNWTLIAVLPGSP